MTIQEAFDLLTELLVSEYFGEKCDEMVDTLWQAAEKQIPKMPIAKEDEVFGDIHIECPTCGNRALFNPFSNIKNCNYPYCPNCGQALNWGEKDDHG